jgi:hypothetical protein
VGLGKWIHAWSMSWPDDNGTVHSCAQAGDMSMPPQGAFLPRNVEPVGEVLVREDGVLSYHWHPISPTVEPLLHSMPTGDNIF